MEHWLRRAAAHEHSDKRWVAAGDGLSTIGRFKRANQAFATVDHQQHRRGLFGARVEPWLYDPAATSACLRQGFLDICAVCGCDMHGKRALCLCNECSCVSQDVILATYNPEAGGGRRLP